jgi:hypothetical protein
MNQQFNNNDYKSELLNENQNYVANILNNLKNDTEFFNLKTSECNLSYISIYMTILNIVLKSIISYEKIVNINVLKNNFCSVNTFLNFKKIIENPLKEVLPNIKQCLELIKQQNKNILKTPNELACEIYQDIKKDNISNIINTIPISSQIIKNVLIANNIDSSLLIPEIIYNITLDEDMQTTCEIFASVVELIGYGEHDNHKWIACKINNFIKYIMLTPSTTELINYENYKLFDSPLQLELLNFPILNVQIDNGINKKHIFYELMIDFDKTFMEYNDNKLKEMKLTKTMKFLHMPELLLNRDVSNPTKLGKMIINSGMKFNIVTSRRQIKDDEEINFKNALKTIAPNVINFSMQKQKNYKKSWQGLDKFNRASAISKSFIFFDDDENVITAMKENNNSCIHYENDEIISNIRYDNLFVEKSEKNIIVGIQGLIGSGKTLIFNELKKLYEEEENNKNIKIIDNIDNISETKNNVYLLDIGMMHTQIKSQLTHKYCLWSNAEWYYTLCIIYSLSNKNSSTKIDGLDKLNYYDNDINKMVENLKI